VSEYLLDNHGIFNAGDHFDAAATLSAGLDIDVEDALEALHPEPAPDLIRGHGRPTFGRRLVLRLIRRFGLVALTPFGGRHQRTVLAVRSEYTVKAGEGEVDAWLGHQGGEPGDEVQGLENDMRGAVAIRDFQLTAHLALCGQ